MYTFYGCGTTYMGVTPAQGRGAHFATMWVVIFDLPVLPLRREVVVFGEQEYVGSGGSTRQQFRAVGRLRLSWRSVLLTYVLAWLVFMPALLGPLAVGIVVAVTRKVELPGWFFVLYVVWAFLVLGATYFVRRKDPST